MAGSAQLRPMTADDFDAAIAVALSLPEWFNDLGIEQITDALPGQLGAVAEVDGEVIGWVTWRSRGSLGEIAWIAVSPDHHRHGVGARLIAFAEGRLGISGVTDVQVETLGESIEYEPYDRTRAFYRALGFRDFKSVLTDNPGMPESLTLQKPLSPKTDD